MTETLHRDSWDQYAAICEKKIADLTADNERLRAALKECAAEFRSRPCTMSEAPEIVGREFQRRMEIAAAALGVNEQKAQDK